MTEKKRGEKRKKSWKVLLWLLLPHGRTPVAPEVAAASPCCSYNLHVLGLASPANGTGFLWLETKQPHSFRLL